MTPPHPALLELAAGRALPPVLDPGALVRSACEHRMHGLLWGTIRDDAARIDDASRRTLAEHALAARAQQRQLWNALTRTNATLYRLGVDIATVKGVTAESRWYDWPGARPCTDLDLLLAPDDIRRAGEIVSALDPAHPLAAEISSLAAADRLQSVEVNVDGVPVDLHFDLFKLGIPSRQREAIWERTQPFTLPDGSRVLVIDPETALVHFLLHLNKDRFRALLGFADVAHVLEREPLDWAAVRRLVDADGLDVVVTNALEAICTTLTLRYPPAAVGPRGGWRAVLWHRLWPPAVRLQGDVGLVRYRYRQAWLPFLARGRLIETARWWGRRLFPDPVLAAYRSPGTPGGYLGRVTLARAARFTERRREARRVAATEPTHRNADPAGPLHRPATATAALLRRAAANQSLRIQVHGTSMGFSIPDGSVVEVRAAPRPTRGEVWAYRAEDGAVVIHRSVGGAAGAWRFHGDRSAAADALVADDRLIGRVVRVEHRGHQLSRARWSPTAGAAHRAGRRTAARVLRALRRPGADPEHAG